MQTNQAAIPGDPRVAVLRCHHRPGKASLQTCAYLRSLERLRALIDRAELEHPQGEDSEPVIGELWLLMADVSTAFDHCPDTRILSQ